MITIPGYKVHSQLHASENVSVYRGVSLENNRSVTIKILNAQYPSDEDIARLQHEYNLIMDLKFPGAIYWKGDAV